MKHIKINVFKKIGGQKIKMNHLTLEQWYQIEINKRYGMSIAKIAERVGKNKSTISRELNGINRSNIPVFMER